jgi:sigma-B regulation protein RsbU (phosphoserine phosphatase)
MTKKVLSIRLSEIGDPVAAVKKTNADIVKDMDRSSFVTVAAIVFDPASRTLTSARAGHNPPMIYSPSKGGVSKFEGGGLMIGMAQPHIFDAQLVPETVEVQPGDVLLLYTDGIEEGKNPSGEEFGTGRIEPVLKNECAKPPSYVLGSLFYEFERFSTGVTQEDDLTAVCVKFK